MDEKMNNSEPPIAGSARKKASESVHIAGVTGSSPVSPTKQNQTVSRKAVAQNTGRLSSNGTIAILPHLEKAGVIGRFWSKVEIGEPSVCWPWRARKANHRRGYGVFKLASYTPVVASRVAYAIAHGEEPGSYIVCHHCDNPSCCNPSHLFLGTQHDNMRDWAKKGCKRNPAMEQRS